MLARPAHRTTVSSSRWSKQRITTLIAVAIHVGLFLAVRRVPPPHVIEAASQSPDDLELDLVVLEKENGDVALLRDLEEGVATLGRGVAASRQTSSFSATTEDTPSPEGEGHIEPAPPSEQGTVMLFVPSPSTIGLSGVGAGVNPFLARGSGTTGETPRPAATTGTARPAPPSSYESNSGVKQTMRESVAHRASIGLGPEGPVLTAFQDATYGGLAPVIGSATFVATVDVNGFVVDIKLLNTHPKTKDAESGWDDAREQAKKALAGKKLALRGSNGAELRIDVSSDWLLPSGNRPKDFPVQPTLRLNGKEVLHPKPKENLMAPSGESAPVTLATFDLSDIGAKPRRIVHTRLVSVTELDEAPPKSD